MTHGSLFSGIGGFDLAAEWMGWQNIFHCEINPFGRKVLNYYWPESISYEDIKKTDFTKHRGTIDVLSGGVPCQPASLVGKRKGKEDERWLWDEYFRAVREIQPGFAVAENVRGLLSLEQGVVFDSLLAQMEAEGYEVLPFLLPACAVNAPHRRDRIWIVAKNTRSNGRRNGEHEKSGSIRDERELSTGGQEWDTPKEDGGTTPNPNSKRGQVSEQQVNADKGGVNALDDARQIGDVADTNLQGSQRSKVNRSIGEIRTEREQQSVRPLPPTWQNFPTQPPLCGGNDGLPKWMAFDAIFKQLGIEYPRQPSLGFGKWRNESIKAYGNAIVPQVAYEIFKVIDQLWHSE